MKNLFLSLAVLLSTGLCVASCSDATVVSDEMPAMRDYQTDAEVLSKFVDVNKSLGEYYINVNKKNSPLAYIYDSDYQELQKVSPANRTRFEDELKALNSKLAVAAKREDVSQIVYSTYGGETWIRTINHDAAVTIEKTSPEEVGTVVTRDTRASLQLQADTVNEANFYAGTQIKSKIDINMFGYKYYYFEIGCKTDAKKTPESGGYPSGNGDNDRAIVMSGSGSMETWNFTWKASGSNPNTYWKFKGYLYNPTATGACLIRIDFID
ncbi:MULTISPECIES: hypothetical protein [Bacteroidales]|jgi:hypothetical protein|uniref:hypothetical protein n=1 Tax=Bacteroidales TaxID=171549 RepID=UPI00068E2113|nr:MULTISPECIES: hypothetical protein [Bacteroidales]WMI44630.1 hypothetical protein Q8809_09965 [Parabacteroides distasonis]